MKVTVLLFAGPREAAGRRSVEVALPGASATAREVVDALAAAHPSVAPWRDRAALAVNRRVAGPQDAVRDGDEVALLPPVSGGGLSADGFSLDGTLAALGRDGAGACVMFVGLVRSPAPEGPVDALEFDAYEAMAEAELAAVAGRARAKFGLVDARLAHRIGRVARGEPVVLVAVTAPHRREAFEAAQWIMEELKTVVPIWKKEAGPWGERWLPEGRE